LYDRQYLDEMTSGWEKLRDRALAEYSPERVADICRIPVETIESLATRYGTTRPTFIRLNYGLQRHAGGGSALRAISILPGIASACLRDSVATISSPSSSNISRPTPLITRTCCCPRQRSSSTTICTRRTAISM